MLAHTQSETVTVYSTQSTALNSTAGPSQALAPTR